MGYIVVDAEGETLLLGVLEYSDDLVRSGILGTQTVSAGVDLDCIELGTLECCNYIEIQRLAEGAGLLGSVENGDLLYGIRESLDELLSYDRRTRTIPYLPPCAFR